MQRRTALSLYAAAAILCTAGILASVVNEIWKGNSLLPQPTPTETGLPRQVGAITNPGDGQAALAADTSVFWSTTYKACGHVHVEERKPDAADIGLSYQQFADRHPGWSLVVSANVLRMERTVETWCPEHYFIKSASDGTIFVYRNLEGGDQLTVVSKLSFGLSAVPQDYQQYIRDGIAFASMEEIESFIESAET